MNHSFQEGPVIPEGTSASEAAWIFAQIILGKSLPRPSSARKACARHVGAHIEREQLEWLAKFSPKHERMLQNVLHEEAKARADREQLEWLAQISEKHEIQLRELVAEEAALREAQARYEQLGEDQSALLQEWDPSKHPRCGSAPNAGWFASTGGAGGGGGANRVSHKIPVTHAIYSGPKRVAAQQVSVSPVGHHYVPVGVVFSSDIRPLLSDEAVQYAMGAYSGKLTKRHHGGEYGGVHHTIYNAEVKKELLSFIKQRKIKTMTAQQMEEFAGLMKKGLGASGKAHKQIGPFNRAIQELVPKGTVVPTQLEEVVPAGRRYMKHSRFQGLAAIGVLSGFLNDAIGAEIDILKTAAKSKHYRLAIQALQDGDIDKAHQLLTNEKNSLYVDIQQNNNSVAGQMMALDFKTRMDQAFVDAHNKTYK